MYIRKLVRILFCLLMISCYSKTNREASSSHETITPPPSPPAGIPDNCPEGFVGVPPLESYTTHGFCVAKYEMKNAGAATADNEEDDKAVSQAAGVPYKKISRDEAIDKCQQMSSDGSDHYDLITNDEWQTLARHIESVPNNWSGGAMGSGDLNQGHSFERSPANPIDLIMGNLNFLEASSDDDESCFGMDIPVTEDCSGDIWHKQKRTHNLFNGQMIWDLAGNVAEWVKDNNTVDYGLNDYISRITTTSHTTAGRLSGGTTTVERVAKDQFGPRGDYVDHVSDIYAGLGYADMNLSDPRLPNGPIPSGGTVVRGNNLINYSNISGISFGGVFDVDLRFPASDVNSYHRVGFRCVYHP